MNARNGSTRDKFYIEQEAPESVRNKIEEKEGLLDEKIKHILQQFGCGLYDSIGIELKKNPLRQKEFWSTIFFECTDNTNCRHIHILNQIYIEAKRRISLFEAEKEIIIEDIELTALRISAAKNDARKTGKTKRSTPKEHERINKGSGNIYRNKRRIFPKCFEKIAISKNKRYLSDCSTHTMLSADEDEKKILPLFDENNNIEYFSLLLSSKLNGLNNELAILDDKIQEHKRVFGVQMYERLLSAEEKTENVRGNSKKYTSKHVVLLSYQKAKKDVDQIINSHEQI